MPNWTESMQQTFEYYTVDPKTWQDIKKLEKVKSCTIDYDLGSDTLGSATFDMDESIGECYVRVYLITIQNGVKEKHVLGTVLAQTTPSSFDGKTTNVSVDAYTPLIELKENYPDLGYYIPEGENIMEWAYRLASENMRAPVVKTSCDDTLSVNFVADTADTWFDYVSALISNAKYTFMLDEMGRILFSPKQDTASLQPVWTYDDGNSSILYPDIDMDRDLYGIPNVVEVLCSNGVDIFHAVVENNDISSPTSIPNRGRRITHRVTDPDIVGTATQDRVDEYARLLLEELSSIECTLTYSHGYCPVRVGDCIRLNYDRSGLTNIKARVVSQSINCESGCMVNETAVFTTKLWR